MIIIIIIFPFWWLSFNKHSISLERDSRTCKCVLPIRLASLCVLRHERHILCGCFPPADRKRAAVQRPETISTYLLLGIVGSIFLHIVHNPVCPCCMNCDRGWLASALFRQGRPVSNGQCRRIGKMIPPHVSDRWVLAQHI